MKVEEEDKVPFKSESQKRFLFAKKPVVAMEFASRTPKNANLPERVKKRKKRFDALSAPRRA